MPKHNILCLFLSLPHCFLRGTRELLIRYQVTNLIKLQPYNTGTLKQSALMFIKSPVIFRLLMLSEP